MKVSNYDESCRRDRVSTHIPARQSAFLDNNLKTSIGHPSTRHRMTHMGVKRLCRLHEEETMLSDMPPYLKLHILSFLDAKHAVETMILSKSWVYLWTCIPALNFCSDGFRNLHDFDNFVLHALSCRDSVKLDKLTFIRSGKCNVEILEKVFSYAFSHGVEELEAKIKITINEESWPIASSDSLRSLKLESEILMDCLFLEPRSGSFKNLAILHLRRAVITDPDPFSVFPVLKTLNLECCFLRTDGNVLNVHCLQLTEFTILYYGQDVTRCEFTTPKLRSFVWQGGNIPRLTAHLPVLDTAVIDYNGYCVKKELKIMSTNMHMLLNTLYKARSLRVSSSIVHLLTLFPDELVNRRSPFRALRCLKLDLTSFRKWCDGACRSLMELLELVTTVEAYFLRESPDAKSTIMMMSNAQALMQ